MKRCFLGVPCLLSQVMVFQFLSGLITLWMLSLQFERDFATRMPPQVSRLIIFYNLSWIWSGKGLVRILVSILKSSLISWNWELNHSSETRRISFFANKSKKGNESDNKLITHNGRKIRIDYSVNIQFLVSERNKIKWRSKDEQNWN